MSDTDKTIQISPTLMVRLRRIKKGGARKKEKMKGKIFGVLYSAAAESPLGSWELIGKWIFFEKGSKIGQQGEPDRI